MTEITVDIDKALLKNLNEYALAIESSLNEVIIKCIEKELTNHKRADNMESIVLNQEVMEKVNIISRLTDRTPEEVVNDTLWDNLRDVDDIPDEIDGDKIWNMLDHDNPEGDDILDNLIRFGEEGWD